jgi:hypothetical protein
VIQKRGLECGAEIRQIGRCQIPTVRPGESTLDLDRAVVIDPGTSHVTDPMLLKSRRNPVCADGKLPEGDDWEVLHVNPALQHTVQRMATNVSQTGHPQLFPKPYSLSRSADLAGT